MIIFAKLTGLLLNPALWVVAVLVFQLMAKDGKIKKRLCIVSIFLALLFSNGWLIKNIISRYQSKPMPLQEGERYRYCILLSGMAGYDDTDRQGYFMPASDRFIQALRLYKLGYVEKIIITGGQGNPFSTHNLRESDFLVKTFLEMGVPANDLINERDARNTIENAKNTKHVLDSLHVQETCLLVTSAIHMPRAKRIFQSESVNIRPFPCDYAIKPSGSRLSWQSVIPSSDAFNHWSVLLKEWMGYASLLVTGR